MGHEFPFILKSMDPFSFLMNSSRMVAWYKVSMRVYIFFATLIFLTTNLLASDPIFEINIESGNKTTPLLVGEGKVRLPLDKGSQWICYFEAAKSKNNSNLTVGSMDCSSFPKSGSIIVGEAISCPQLSAMVRQLRFEPTSSEMELFYAMSLRDLTLTEKVGKDPVRITMQCHLPAPIKMQKK